MGKLGCLSGRGKYLKADCNQTEAGKLTAGASGKGLFREVDTCRLNLSDFRRRGLCEELVYEVSMVFLRWLKMI